MRIRKETILPDDFQDIDFDLIADVSDALAHPVRLQLFRYIMQCNKNRENVCTKDLVENFDYAQATISQHMKKLTKSGLVEIQKDQKFSYFYANLGLLTRYLKATKLFATR